MKRYAIIEDISADKKRYDIILNPKRIGIHSIRVDRVLWSYNDRELSGNSVDYIGASWKLKFITEQEAFMEML